MSTFHKFKWSGYEITVRPKGIRGAFLVRKIPHWTGDRLILTVNHRWRGPDRPPEGEYLKLRLQRVADLEHISGAKVISTGGGERWENEVDFGYISFSGEYRLAAVKGGEHIVERATRHMPYEEVLEQGVAAIEVKRDSILLTPLWVVAGVFMTLAIQWGWNEFTEPKTPEPLASQSEPSSNVPSPSPDS